MLDFLNSDDENNKQKTNAILTAFLKGLSNLFDKTFAFKSNGRPTLFSFLPKILGQFFQVVKTFTHSLFDHSDDPTVKEMLETKVDPICDGVTQAAKKAETEGLSTFVRDIISTSGYKNAINTDGDMLTMFSNLFTSSPSAKTNAPQPEPESSTAKNRP